MASLRFNKRSTVQRGKNSTTASTTTTKAVGPKTFPNGRRNIALRCARSCARTSSRHSLPARLQMRRQNRGGKSGSSLYKNHGSPEGFMSYIEKSLGQGETLVMR